MVDKEAIVYEHDFQKDLLDQALQMVASFILKNKRILSGGMSIDMALRKHKKKLYPDNKFPDYDFYSPIFHIDAYSLGMELLNNLPTGTTISVIRALHVSTMTVRVNFQVVADITFIPRNLYEKIHTLEHNGFTIVHPHFQMIDQHKALAMPFENVPFETVLHRWAKDIERYTLLYKHYPVTDMKMEDQQLIKYTIPIEKLQDECVSGYPSLVYWATKASKDGFNEKMDIWYTSWVHKNTEILLFLPDDATFNIISDDYSGCGKKFEHTDATTQHYNAILDKVPPRYTLDSDQQHFEIIDGKDSLNSAHEYKDFHISNLQEVMCYLLTMTKFYKLSIANNAYIIAQKILFWASEQYIKTNDKKFLDYLPTVSVYGKSNVLAAHKLMKHEFDIRFENKDRTLATPRNAYPEKDRPIPKNFYDFDPATSPLYQYDGEPVEW